MDTVKGRVNNKRSWSWSLACLACTGGGSRQAGEVNKRTLLSGKLLLNKTKWQTQKDSRRTRTWIKNNRFGFGALFSMGTKFYFLYLGWFSSHLASLCTLQKGNAEGVKGWKVKLHIFNVFPNGTERAVAYLVCNLYFKPAKPWWSW